MPYGIRLHCWGEWALFSRPEMKVERVSYDFITPSAARGVLEAIYWKPQIRWVIDRIHVLQPIRHASLRRNEVGARIPESTARQAMKAGRGRLGLYVETERQQRAALMLRDVGYVIEAHFDLLGAEQNEAKHLDQFNRRARAGQCFTRPYFGTRECAAEFSLIEHDGEMPPVHPDLMDNAPRDLGWMLHDIDFANGRQPRFFKAIMLNGVVEVPPLTSAEVHS